MSHILRHEDLIKIVQKLTRFLRRDVIRFDEYADNVILHLVGQSFETMKAALADLSSAETNELVRYARSYLAKNNFEPSPTVFMVDTSDARKVEMKRQEMRPKYEQLMKDLERCVNQE